MPSHSVNTSATCRHWAACLLAICLFCGATASDAQQPGSAPPYQPAGPEAYHLSSQAHSDLARLIRRGSKASLLVPLIACGNDGGATTTAESPTPLEWWCARQEDILSGNPAFVGEMLDLALREPDTDNGWLAAQALCCVSELAPDAAAQDALRRILAEHPDSLAGESIAIASVRGRIFGDSRLAELLSVDAPVAAAGTPLAAYLPLVEAARENPEKAFRELARLVESTERGRKQTSLAAATNPSVAGNDPVVYARARQAQLSLAQMRDLWSALGAIEYRDQCDRSLRRLYVAMHPRPADSARVSTLRATDHEAPGRIPPDKRIEAIASLAFHASFLDQADLCADCSFVDGVVQLFLSDLVERIKTATDAAELQPYEDCFVRSIAMSLRKSDRAASLAYVCEQAAAELADASRPQLDPFRAFLAQEFTALESNELALAQLKYLSEKATDPGRRVAALFAMSDLYRKVWNTPEVAIASLKKVAEMGGDTVDGQKASVETAKIHYEAKAYLDAIFELEELLARKKLLIDENAPRTLLGLSYFASGEVDAARAEFARVINADRAELREKCLYLMGYSFISEQRYADAERPFRDLIELYPKGSYADRARDYLAKIAK